MADSIGVRLQQMLDRDAFAQKAAEHGFAHGLDEPWEHDALGDVCFVGYRTRNWRYPYLVKQMDTGKLFKLTRGNAFQGVTWGCVIRPGGGA